MENLSISKCKFIDRLEAFMKVSDLNENQMRVKANLSNGLIGKALKKRGPMNSDSIERILNAFPALNADWLMTGRGEMFLQTDTKEGNYEDLTVYLKHQINELKEELKMEREKNGHLFKTIGALENEIKNLSSRSNLEGGGLSQSLSLLEIKDKKINK